MDEVSPAGAVRAEQGGGGEWMLPSAALDRFEPPAGLVVAESVQEEHARYGFRIGALGLLIKEDCGSEVMQLPALWSLPGAPPWLLGLINLRGNLVPLYELRQILSLGAKATDSKSLVLVFDQGEKAVAVVVDDFPQPLQGLTLLPHLPQLPTALAGHVRRGFVKDHDIWLEFDQDTFFEALTHRG